jgi:uncharacterized membrane protein
MSKKLIQSALATVIAVGITSQAFAIAGATHSTSQVHGKKTTTEKCYGIAKAGKNDCATNACSGSSTKDSDKKAWLGVPQGTCDKIVGGSTTEG